MSAFNGNYIEYESKGDEDKNLSIKKYLYKIIPYLRDMINDHKAPKELRLHSRNEVIDYETQFGEWKIQLTIQVNFITSKDSKEIRTMYTKNCNAAIMIGSEKDDIITELIDSLLQNYQINLEESTRGSELIFDSIDLLYYHLQKISLKRGGSYIDSPKQIKNKKATRNPQNDDDNCFQYALMAALHHQNSKSHPERISNLKPFIKDYEWKGMDFHTQKTGKSLNKTIRQSLLISYLYHTILKK